MVDKTSDEWLNCVCGVCGKRFHKKPSHAKKCKNHYCSMKCHYEGKKTYMSGAGNHQYGLKGDKNGTWKADRKLSRYGYIQVRVLDHPFRDKADFVFEHRLVAEKYLLTDENSVVVDGKRYLSPDYVVHHKNFDRTDNRVSNLAVMTKAEHQRFHSNLNNNSQDEKSGRFVSTFRLFKRVSDKTKMPRKVDNNEYLVTANIDAPITLKRGECYMIDTGIVPIPPKGMAATLFAIGKLGNENEPLYKNCVKTSTSDKRGSLRVAIENNTDHDITITTDDEIFLISFEPYFVPKVKLVSSF